MTARTHRAVLEKVEADRDVAPPSPQDAPPPPDAAAPPIARRRRRSMGFWTRLVTVSAAALIGAVATLAFIALVESWMARAPWFGWTLTALAAILVVALVVLAARELLALARLRRVAEIRAAADAEFSGAAAQIERLYAGRADLAWARARLAEAPAAGDDRLAQVERMLLAPLDAEAKAAVARASRRVAAATALMPSALIDAAASLYVNLAMIRRIAEIYGGRAGALGSLSLARRVVAHAMAAGLIAIGDDLLEPLIGGGVANRLSRRLGEGVVNGAMTARIGFAAMDFCRPAPYRAAPRPKLREVAWSALRVGGRQEGADRA